MKSIRKTDGVAGADALVTTAPACFRAGVLLMASLAIAAVPAPAGQSNIEDVEISAQIENELFSARGVSANEIDLNVDDGVVTLSGTVDHILARERAVRIARLTKGVRSVVDHLIVRKGDRSDATVRSDVIAALAADPVTESWEINVAVRGGTVTLTGKVESYAEKKLSETITKTVRGVRDVKNDIDIAYQRQRLDSDIRDDILARLQWDVRIDGALIEVGVNKGKVKLSGAVGSAYERSLARADAWVNGVNAVDASDLEVEWWARDQMQRDTDWADLDDAEIAAAVEKAFSDDPRVSAFEPDVRVENGVVTLTGVVDNLKAKRAAAQDARNTLGVLRVKNYLKIRPAVARDESVIESDIRQAFLRDPLVERYEITVSAVDGTVHLYGQVDSHFERQQAEDIATRVPGVTDVHNYLNVPYELPAFGYNWYYDWDPTLYDFDYDYDLVRIRSDAEIKEDVESELFWSPFVDGDDVAVSVDNGEVTLSGEVDSWIEHDAATENAIEGGALRVVNKLDVL